MANSFADLKKSRSQALEKLTGELSKLSNKEEGKKSYEDDRFWKPTVDKAGNGMATIRFLPSPEGEDMPWVQIFSHSIQGPTGQWLIDNCLTTINQKCPVCEHNTILWNSGIEANKEVVRKQKRKLQYIANIYIVKDPANPENDGTVRLFKFGKKIFDKIMEAMQPEYEDETPINAFDFWQGANFKLKAKSVAGYRNYDSSEFAAVGALLDDDDAMEAIWKKQYSLTEFVAPDQFKTYEELKKRLDSVLGAKTSTRLDEEVEDEDDTRGSVRDLDDDLRSELNNLQPTRRAAVVEDDDEDSDAMSYFAKLAED